jgi:transposase
VVAVRRVETPPGKQAQVDWGHLGSLLESGEERMLWGFTMTLGYSRLMMAEAATDQKLGTLLRIHEAAFQQWGSVPEEILYDRMKTVWTGTDERGEIIKCAVFLDFTRYWGFTPRLCRPYPAQRKEKMEWGVKYVRRNFLCVCRSRAVEHGRSQRGATPLDSGSHQSTRTRNESLTGVDSLGRRSVQYAAGEQPSTLPVRR